MESAHAKRHAGKRSSKDDIDDWTQDLYAHMGSLPRTSKFRKVGSRDVIQTFDPARHFGANLPRFLNYVNHCLANKFRTIHSNRLKNPISHAISLSGFDVGEATPSEGHPHQVVLSRLKTIDSAQQKQTEDKLLIEEFAHFVRVQNPRLLPVLEAILMMEKHGEAAKALGVAGSDGERLFRQVRELARSFLSRKSLTQRPSDRETQCGMRVKSSCIATCSAIAERSGTPFNYIWNRVDLYNEVWNQPLIKLSRKYRISDVRLGKVCRTLKIPHPGRGYWAKKAAGAVVEQMPLPELTEVPVVKRLRKIRGRGINRNFKTSSR